MRLILTVSLLLFGFEVSAKDCEDVFHDYSEPTLEELDLLQTMVEDDLSSFINFTDDVYLNPIRHCGFPSTTVLVMASSTTMPLMLHMRFETLKISTSNEEAIDDFISIKNDLILHEDTLDRLNLGLVGLIYIYVIAELHELERNAEAEELVEEAIFLFDRFLDDDIPFERADIFLFHIAARSFEIRDDKELLAWLEQKIRTVGYTSNLYEPHDDYFAVINAAYR